MARGAEAYLQTWERAYGVAPDSCRNPGLRESVREVGRLLRPGMSTRAVLDAVGQPYQRLGRAYRFCAESATDPKVMVTVRFDRSGRSIATRLR